MKKILLIWLCFLTQSTNANAFTYDDLVRLIQQKQLTSVEEVLPLLPKSLRSNYTLMHRSLSLQEASYSNPRAILYGEDASLTCTFNGDPNQYGFDTLECFQFRKSESRFDFRQIQFPTPSNGLSAVAFSQSNRSADGRISCAACHSADPRPNWSQWWTYAGAYGSEADMIENDAQEEKQYPNFVERRAEHPRYKWLIQGPQKMAPYKLLRPADPFYNGPNLSFGDYINGPNAFRMKRILSASAPRWQMLAWAVSNLFCPLNKTQLEKLNKTGLDYKTDMDPKHIYQSWNISYYDWSPQLNYGGSEPQDFDFNSGHRYMSQDVGMAVVQAEADAGNLALKTGLRSIRASIKNPYTLKLFEIAPWFPSHQKPEGQKFICPELTKLFVEEYISAHKPAGSL